MATFTLRFNAETAVKNIGRLRDRAPQAVARALNRSIGSAKTLGVREVSRDMGLKVSDVRERIGTTEARPQRLVAQLSASLKRIPLIDFGARATRRGGVTARMPGGAGRYPRAFIATMRSGKRGVFERRPGARRLPIYELRGPSVVKAFEKFAPAAMARGQEQLVKNLRSELRYATAA